MWNCTKDLPMCFYATFDFCKRDLYISLSTIDFWWRSTKKSYLFSNKCLCGVDIFQKGKGIYLRWNFQYKNRHELHILEQSDAKSWIKVDIMVSQVLLTNLLSGLKIWILRLLTVLGLIFCHLRDTLATGSGEDHLLEGVLLLENIHGISTHEHNYVQKGHFQWPYYSQQPVLFLTYRTAHTK